MRSPLASCQVSRWTSFPWACRMISKSQLKRDPLACAWVRLSLGREPRLKHDDTGEHRAMRLVDRLCAGTLFGIAVVDCLLVQRPYTGRIWIFGTGLALQFPAMLHTLCMRPAIVVDGLHLLSI